MRKNYINQKGDYACQLIPLLNYQIEKNGRSRLK